ncbi:glycine betaine/proline transport system permease [Enterococcus sp. AZ150]|uniref:Glycine betaine ABC transporter substrate-binding protein n=1 Tax=Enterococcus sulfureus ATCC 49903 TaxID=1140003 RepID=S0KQL7_9ENTE|nr:ABC transporter permease/substrate binding protein [Enterococcus sulfureus]EOT46942.1 glycine betaine ABC transporter substrate-binding protein [Enterococcus sulfureus ATCC 49903]EOT83763.1 glycine betaine ABC transporter substrate-binding protein [Enterococcus sulfureus ATCC 49903]
MDNFLQQSIPVADWVESASSWITTTFSGLFQVVQDGGTAGMNFITNVLTLINPLLFIVVMTVAAFMISGRKWGLAAFSFIGLLYIYNQNLWGDLMNTVTLVIVSSLVSIIIGVPLGIWMAKSDRAEKVIQPILDFMQTMPGFVYLIPAVAFFGIGMVPGVFASVIFALPPTVRFTNLGIRQIPKELVEASDSFGSTGRQRLFKLELPLAKSTILAGINQTTMLALSMVVIASMIGAPGLGRGVLSALQHAQVGNGFVNGLALVILAIIIDRFTQLINKPNHQKEKAVSKKTSRIVTVVALAAIVVSIVSGAFFSGKDNQAGAKGTVNLAYVEWDTEVASTNVVGEVLKQMGYTVNLTPLDNAIMWQSVATGQSDAMLSAWLPSTHKPQYEKYKDQLVDLGPNLEGAKVGLVVPSYMDVNSIEDLKDQANKEIVGIEPGSGAVAAAEKTQEAYPNLADWKVSTSSSGAMMVALDQAYQNKQPIVITGWSPHWMFAKYDLKYLEDPKETMGGAESIHTMTREGFKEDMPEVNEVLDNFNWTTDDVEEVMLEISNGTSPEKAAQNWIEKNQDKVDEWTK